jgi:hypothetical protein
MSGLPYLATSITEVDPYRANSLIFIPFRSCLAIPDIKANAPLRLRFWQCGAWDALSAGGGILSAENANNGNDQQSQKLLAGDV